MKTRVNWGNPEETEDLVFNQGKNSHTILVIIEMGKA